MRQSTKPVKPHKSFPLTPHVRGWVKKIDGKVVWIAPPDATPQEALAAWRRREAANTAKPAHNASVLPAAPKNGQTVRAIANRWLNSKAMERDAARITADHYVWHVAGWP